MYALAHAISRKNKATFCFSLPILLNQICMSVPPQEGDNNLVAQIENEVKKCQDDQNGKEEERKCRNGKMK